MIEIQLVQKGDEVAGSLAVADQSSTNPKCLDLAALSPLMSRTSDRPELSIGLIDGPVALDDSDLASENIREVPGRSRPTSYPPSV